MKKTDFKIETFPRKRFSGFTATENWNGWACPYFTFEEAQKVVTLQNELPGNSARYDREKDTFLFEFNGEIEEYTGELIGGIILYPIGSGNWIWEEVGTVQN